MGQWLRWANKAAICGAVFILGLPPVTSASIAMNGRIAYTQFYRADAEEEGRSEIWSVDPDGTNPRIHFSARDEWNGDPAWSPDGEWLSFWRQGDLLLGRPDGSGVRTLAAERYGDPSWSPDGTRLVVDGGWEIFVLNADGSDRHMILQNALRPAWSPAGDQIAYESRVDGDFEIYTYDLYTGRVLQLTHNADPLDDYYQPASDGSPEWSPDGSRIAFISNRDAPVDCNYCLGDIYIMNADGSDEVRIPLTGSEYGLTWSPDGSSLGFLHNPKVPSNDQPWLARLDLATKVVTKITRSEGSSKPDWRPIPGSMPTADLSMSLATDAAAYALDSLTTVDATITNHGTAEALDPIFLIELPAARVSSSMSCSGLERTACDLENIPAGTSVDVSFNVAMGEPGAKRVGAMITSDIADPEVLNNRKVAEFMSCSELGTQGDDEVVGTEGDDVLCGAGGTDVLTGGGGNDLLMGGPGSDRVEGGEGVDVVTFLDATAGVVADLRTGVARTGSDVETLTQVEGMVGSPDADRLKGSAWRDRLAGGGGRDVLMGSSGDDRLDGGAGNDRLIGGAGSDVVRGGMGVDALDLRTSRRVVRVDLGSARASGQGYDRVLDVEAVLGSRFADLITGSILPNRLGGGRGSDILIAKGSDDDLSGGRGDDRLSGGDGRDALFGGRGTDTCQQGAGSGRRRGCETS